jgi:hypothetical protein
MGGDDYEDNLSKYKASVKKYNDISNNVDHSAKLDELSKEVTKEYTLFIIWLIIAIILILLTSITVIYQTEINPLIWIISIVFIIYCSFYIFKNVYHLL